VSDDNQENKDPGEAVAGDVEPEEQQRLDDEARENDPYQAKSDERLEYEHDPQTMGRDFRVEGNDVRDYIGVDPEYRTYANATEAPILTDAERFQYTNQYDHLEGNVDHEYDEDEERRRQEERDASVNYAGHSVNSLDAPKDDETPKTDGTPKTDEEREAAERANAERLEREEATADDATDKEAVEREQTTSFPQFRA